MVGGKRLPSAFHPPSVFGQGTTSVVVHRAAGLQGIRGEPLFARPTRAVRCSYGCPSRSTTFLKDRSVSSWSRSSKCLPNACNCPPTPQAQSVLREPAFSRDLRERVAENLLAIEDDHARRRIP